MKDLKNVANMSSSELNRLRAKLYVQHVEMGWKADKAALRLKKRLQREAKKHTSLEPLRKLLREALIIKEALLPLGDTEALTLVEQQIASYEAKIADVTYRYRLLSDEEIALKEMQIVLLYEKASVVNVYLTSVEEVIAMREVERVVSSPLVQETSVEVSSRETISIVNDHEVVMSEDAMNRGGWKWSRVRSLFEKVLRRFSVPEKVYSWR